MARGSFLHVAARRALVQQWIKTLSEFPPRQRPEHWSVRNVLEKLQQNALALEAGKAGGLK
jgi:arylsulfatase